MIYRIETNRKDLDWVEHINTIEPGINCACCNGFAYRIYRAAAFRLVYGIDTSLNSFGRPDFTPETFREYMNTVFERRYFFGRCMYEANFSQYILQDIINVRRLPDNELAEVLLI